MKAKVEIISPNSIVELNKKFLLDISLQLLAIVCGPLILIIVLGGMIWKEIVFLLSKLHGKEFVCTVKSRDVVFASDDFTGKPHSPFCGAFYLEGIPTRARVVSDIQRVYDERGKDGKSRNYWKFACYPVQWCGYWFWKKSISFNIDDRVQFISGDATEDCLTKFVEKQMRKPFEKHGPLWDVTILTNYSPESTNKSLFVYRCSHMIHDGFSFMKFYFKLSGFSKLSNNLPTKEKKSLTCREQISFWTSLYFFGLYRYLKTVKSHDNSVFYKEDKKPSGDWICALGPKLPVELIKKARLSYNCTFFDIIFCAVLGALRKYIAKHHSEKNVPKFMQAFIATAIPDHPDDQFCNHWYPLILDLPLGISDVTQRAREVQRRMLQNIESSYSTVFSLVLEILVALPLASYTDRLTDIRGITMLTSGQPALPNMPPLFNCQLTNGIYWLPINREHVCAMTWTSMTCNGYANLALLVDKSYIEDRKSLKELANLIEEEFENLLKNMQNGSNSKLPFY